MPSLSDSSFSRVSIVIPAFNNPGDVHECLSMLSAQSCGPGEFEVVVVDNGSKPELTVEGGYPFPLVLRRCERPGSYAARNEGVRAARGAIVAFLDSDCRPHEDWLAEGISAVSAGDGDRVAGGEVVVSYPSVRSGIGLYQYILGAQQAENVQQRYFSATANLFCPRKLFDSVGMFDERLLSGGDREWGWRAYQLGIAIVYAPSAVVYTSPRTSLRAAMRQTRRIAAGQVYIRRHRLHHAGAEVMARYRPKRRVPGWILSHPKLSRWERIKVLFAAITMKVTMMFEMRLIRLGGKPERR